MPYANLRYAIHDIPRILFVGIRCKSMKIIWYHQGNKDIFYYQHDIFIIVFLTLMQQESKGKAQRPQRDSPTNARTGSPPPPEGGGHSDMLWVDICFETQRAQRARRFYSYINTILSIYIYHHKIICSPCPQCSLCYIINIVLSFIRMAAPFGG